MRATVPAFPTLAAYPPAPSTFVQSDDGTGLHVQDSTGQIPFILGYSSLERRQLHAGRNRYVQQRGDRTGLRRPRRSGPRAGLRPFTRSDQLVLQPDQVVPRFAGRICKHGDPPCLGPTVGVGDQFRIVFTASLLTGGELYNSTGTLLDTIVVNDASYSSGVVGTWGGRSRARSRARGPI